MMIALTALLAAGAGTASAADLHATPSTFASTVAASQPGDNVLLASGSYGSWKGVTKTSPGITLKPEPGASPTIGLALDTLGNPAWLTIDGVTVTGGTISGPTHDVTFKNLSMPGYLQINPGVSPSANNACGNCPAMNNNNIVFDNVDFTLASCPSGSCLGYEGRVSFAYGSANPAGVTIKNSKFHSGCSDGIQFTGSSNAGRGVTVGPGNEFYNLNQGSCAPHVDAVQFVDGGNVKFTGNYFHDNTHGIVNYDGNPANVQITDNVFVNHFSDTIAVCASTNLLVEHNTVKAPANNWNCVNHNGTGATGTVWRNNIQNEPPQVQGSSAYAVNDYNLCTTGTCAGTHSVNGTPTYVGGANPTTYAGFALAAGSVGKAKGSDGLDLGIRVSGSPPPDTTPPDTTITQAPQDGESTSALVAFTANEASTFQCKLDAASYEACISPRQYSGLSVGQHTVNVRATDSAGNVDPTPATATWTVSAPPAPADDDGDGVPNSSDACRDLRGSRPDGCPTPSESIQMASDLASSLVRVSDLTDTVATRDATIASLRTQLDALQAKIDKALADLAP